MTGRKSLSPEGRIVMLDSVQPSVAGALTGLGHVCLYPVVLSDFFVLEIWAMKYIP